jgi:metal-responsive CopG/Arc/MetJ family transcriptional regulator
MSLLKISTMAWARKMATVNFSVPDDIKAEFDRVFGAQNKSAVIADLMRKAIADVKQRERRVDIFRLLTQRRKQRPSLSDGQIRTSRSAGRP